MRSASTYTIHKKHPGIMHLSNVFVLSGECVCGFIASGSCNVVVSILPGGCGFRTEAAVCKGVWRRLIEVGIEPGDGVEIVSTTGVDGGPRTICAICGTSRSTTATPLT